MCGFTRLKITESARVDLDQFEILRRELGSSGAERQVGRDVEEIGDRIALAWAAYYDDDKPGIASTVQPLAKIAVRTGWSSLARVSLDVKTTAQAGDGPGLAATLERLTRLFETALGDARE